MEGYIYLGQLCDLMGRELNFTDKKIGLSINPLGREYQLNRTKSPIGYRIISAYKVDNMRKVEAMLHAILDSRRTIGEWFKDEEDTLTGEFVNFMEIYGGVRCDIRDVGESNSEPKEEASVEKTEDTRLIDLYQRLGKETILVRTYKGVDYELTLKENGILVFDGEEFDTPNKVYNRGIVKFVTGKRGGSGCNNLSQFKIKETGERLIG